MPYHSIFLLPSLTITRQIAIDNLRFTNFSEARNVLHPRLFWFKAADHVRKLHDAIMTFCAKSIASRNFTSLVSQDSPEVFYYVKWNDKIMLLQALNCLRKTAGVINSYLSQSSALISWDVGSSYQKSEKICPKVSCL